MNGDKVDELSPPAGASNQPNGPRLFTGPERAALVNEIVTELQKDSLKEDVETELEFGTRAKRISKFFQHPAVMLVISFIITGVIGAFLANVWQSREWERQQKLQGKEWERQQLRLLDLHGIDVKYKLIEEITKSIGERNAAARGVVSPLAQNFSNQQLIEEEKERLTNWQKVSTEWRANSQVLKLKIATHIKNQDAAKYFDQIIDKERSIAVGVTMVKNELSKYNGAKIEKDERQQLDGILSTIEKSEQDLKKLVEVIAGEAGTEMTNNAPG